MGFQSNVSFENATSRVAGSESQGHPSAKPKHVPEIREQISASQLLSLDECVHHAIDHQAAQRPDALAVDSWDGKLSYGHLRSRADALASEMLTAGLQSGETVGFMFEKSKYAVVSMLAILKVGCACVALSPTLPFARLETIKQKSRLSFILSSASCQSDAQKLASSNCQVLVVDGNFDQGGSSKLHTVLPATHSKMPAYILFTSGTTGEPKGICVEHGSFRTSAATHGAIWGVGPNTRVFQFSAFNFDVSVADIFTSLMHGSCICVPSERERVEDLTGAINRYAANWIFLTPSVARTLDPCQHPLLRTVVMGGEPATKQLVENWGSRENLSFYICWGPAEGSVYSTSTEPVTLSSDPLNIGRPIPGSCRIFIVDPDDDKKRVNDGEIGEIVIQGRIVARGYINEQRSNAHEAFLNQDPWSRPAPESGLDDRQRIYKTGDLGMINVDGSINIFGRKDSQVKIRGQRVELGEIEHQVKALLPGSLQVIAHLTTTQQSPSLDPELVVFLADAHVQSMVDANGIWNQSWTSRIAGVKHHLVKVLPSYMIPSRFIPLQRLPLTPSGKVDRTALQSLHEEFYLKQKTLIEERSVPNTPDSSSPEEELLKQSWSEILGMPFLTIHPHDNFLSLGGDSLKAMILISKLGKRGYSMSFERVLNSSDLASMSQAMVKASATTGNVRAPDRFSLAAPNAGLEDLKVRSAAVCEVSPQHIVDIYPATPLQEGFMAAAQSTMKDRYISHYALSVSVEQLDKLKAAWEHAYDSMEILRTRLVYLPDCVDTCLQVVVDERLVWNIDDTLESSKEQFGIAGFGQHLSRLSVISPLTPDLGTATILWSVHHSLIDALTVKNVIKHLSAIYLADRAPEHVPFRSFISYLESVDRQRSLEWWNTYLADYSGSVWPESAKNAGTTVQTLSRNSAFTSHQSSTFTAATYFKAAWAYVVSTYSGSDDIVFGSTQSGRAVPVQGILSVTGPTINTVPVRVVCGENRSVRQLLETIHQDAVQMSPHEHVSLQSMKRLRGGPAQAVDFKSLLVVQPPHEEDDSTHPMFKTMESSNMEVGSYPITLEIRQHAGGWTSIMNFQPETICESQAKAILDQYAATVQNFWTIDGSISLHSPTLYLVNAEALDTSPPSQEEEEDVCANFEVMASTQPSAPAVSAFDCSFSYRALHQDMLCAADFLVGSLGVQPGDFVPICAAKSGFVIAIMLAILRAGAAFVPLDSSYPETRLAEIVQIARARIVIVDDDKEASFQGVVPTVITVKRLLSAEPTRSALSTPSVPKPTNVAYVMFTSGSTGRPKAVVVDHAAFVISAKKRATSINRGPHSRVYQFSSYSFDTSIEDILTTLITGGCVCVPSEKDRKTDLAASFRSLQANTIDLTPSVANILKPSDMKGLKTLILGGECVTTSLLDKWKQSRADIINTYGPTEACIVVSVKRVHAGSENVNNIGKFTAGKAWVVHQDNHHQLLPRGAVGELLVEGQILARGYFRNTDETEKAFVRDVGWANDATRRFYKTGDLVRTSCKTGDLIFIGRKDSQVKIRGQRIELGEVSSLVSSAFGVQGVAVLKITLGTSVDVLVAFLDFGDLLQSAETELIPMEGEVKERVVASEKRLITIAPSHMIPSVFIPLSNLPTTTSGKLDQRRLQALVEGMSTKQLKEYRLDGDRDMKPLEGEKQTQLATLWAKVLSVDLASIGQDTDFFRAGGDSLSTMRLSTMLRDVQWELSGAEMMRCPKLSDMATMLRPTSKDQLEQHPFDSEVTNAAMIEKLLSHSGPELQEADIEEVAFCTPTQEAMMTATQKNPSAYIARFDNTVPKDIDINKLCTCWDEVVKRNAILRTTIYLVPDVGTLQVVLKPSVQRLNRNIKHSQYMGYGTLLHYVYFQTQDGSTIITQIMHHAIFDGVSHDLLKQQVYDLYHGNHLGKMATPFTRFSNQVSRIDSQDGRYWTSQLEGDPSWEFFAGREDLTVDERKERHLDHKTLIGNHALETLRSSGISSAILIRAAWALTVSAFSNSDDLVFGVVQSGRNASVVDVQSMVGPTVTTVPVRVRVKGSSTIGEFLSDLKAQAIEMIPHEHVGLQNIKKLTGKTCDLSNLLIVQPPASINQYDSLLPVVNQPNTDDTTGYYTHDLVLECSLSDEGNFQSHAIWTSSKICSTQMTHILEYFGTLIRKLCALDHGSTLTVSRGVGLESLGQHLNVNEQELTGSSAYNTIIDCLREKTLRDPAQPAITAWDGTMSYHELDKETDKLAAHLAQFGPWQHQIDVVPILFEKSLFAVVSMIAIMKVGCAYTAFDITQPTQRLQSMARQVKSKICLVASASLATRLEGHVDKIVVVDRSLLNSLREESDHVPFYQPKPSQAAIIVFTSGSTGNPKPIILSHGAITSCSQAFGPEMRFGKGTRVLSNASYAFDIHACEIFLTLMHGGTLFMTNKDRSHLPTVIAEWSVNWLFSTPSALASLSGPEVIPTVKTLMMIGESPTKDIYAKWRRDDLFLINSYGPAENTLFSTMTAVHSTDQSPSLIGKPINSAVWIVDPGKSDTLLPVGAVGELLLQGSQLADGYLYDDLQTREVFINPPAWLSTNFPWASGRLYKTGDLCQLQVDGTLKIFGRKDSQIKLRGQRLEAGEIEFHIKKTFPKSEVAVDCAKLDDNHQVLVAFIQYDKGPNVDDTDLIVRPTDLFTNVCKAATEDLSHALPTFMIPSYFVPVKYMPHTTSDKLDRKTLRARFLRLPRNDLARYAIEAHTAIVAPRTDTEKQLQELWSNVLGVENGHIGVDSSFIVLGGDSISAIRLASSFAKSLDGLTISVSDILLHPRLKDMALQVQAGNSLTNPSMRPFELVGGAQSELVNGIRKKLTALAGEVEDVYPCTPLQEAFMQATIRNCRAYVSHHVFKIDIPVGDIEKLRKAVERLILLHDVLRTIIVQTDLGDLFQVVMKASEDQVATMDTFETYIGDVDQHTMRCGSKLFKAGVGINAGDLVLVLTAHHSVFDQSSMLQMKDQVMRLLAEQTPSESIPFKYFVRHLHSSPTSHTEDFWRSNLSGLTTSKTLATAIDIKSERMERTICENFRLPARSIDNNITAIARTAWGLVLSLYSESLDVTFGIILSGRGDASKATGFDRVAGPTVNTVPFRIQIDRDQTRCELLEKVLEHGARLMPHSHLGNQRVKKLSSDAANAVMFDSILDVTVDTKRDPSYSSMKLDPESSYYSHPVTVETNFERHGETSLAITFDQNIIPESSATQILGLYGTLIRQLACESRDKPLKELEILSEAEKDLVKKWNNFEPEQGVVKKCIHRMVEEQATKTPSASAIEAWDGCATYERLEVLASSLAGHLALTHNLKAGDKIPICFDKSLWTPVAMLACFKLGAAYVPLDPTHPTQRLKSIVKFVGTKIVIVGESQADRFLDDSSTIIVLGQALMDGLTEEPSWHQSHFSPDSPAMILFTSGSTGMPKGVVISHTSFCTLASLVGEAMDFTKISNLRVLQFAAYAFDVSNAETFLTLIFGGTLCIITDEEKQNDLAGAINRLKINWLYLTPSATRLVEPGQVPTVQTLILGGEAGSKDIITKWAPHVHLVNSFGPCEGGIWPSYAHLSVEDSPLDIGWSAETRLWIVNPANHDQLMGPVGAVGELILEGPMVAQGYLHEPEKTQAAFIAPPKWADEFGAKGPFYKCGDLVRYHPNRSGTLRYVSRKDAQVKLRGQRLDLGEVEHAIKANLPSWEKPEIAAEVVSFADRSEPYPAVFMCSQDFFAGEQNTAKERSFERLRAKIGPLKTSLQAMLPSYMVPSLFIPLPAIPLTMSGKRDRKTLQRLASEMSFSELASFGAEARRPVSSDRERVLQSLWAQTLELNAADVFASDGFFDLGASSIDAMKLVSAARLSGLRLLFSDVFRSVDLSDMANKCRTVAGEPVEHELHQEIEPDTLQDEAVQVIESVLGIHRGHIEDVVEVGDFQSQAFHHAMLESRGTANYLSFELADGMDIHKMETVYRAVLLAYPMLRTVFVHVGQQLRQVVLDASVWNLEIDRLVDVDQASEALKEWMAKDKAKQSSLDRAVTRGAIIIPHQGRPIFVIQQPHARNDAWSDHHFCHDLSLAYNGCNLPDRPPFSAYMRHVQTLDRKPAISYWRDLLQSSEITELASRKGQTNNIVNVTLEQVIPLPEVSGMTAATILKAAWAVVLAQHSTTKDVVFGHLTSGRSLPSFEGVQEVFGPLLNIIPVRVKVSDYESPSSLLRAVQDQHAASTEYEWMGERDIVQSSTDWGDKRFSSVVQMQNIDEVSDVEDAEREQGWKVRLHAVDYDSSDVWVLAYTNSPDKTLRVTVCFSDNVIDRDFGWDLLGRLCRMIEKLAACDGSVLFR